MQALSSTIHFKYRKECLWAKTIYPVFNSKQTRKFLYHREMTINKDTNLISSDANGGSVINNP